MEDLLRVGVIANTHGIRGEVKIYPTTDDVNRFKTLDEAIIDSKNGPVVVHILSCKFFKNLVILKFKEFDHIEDVELFRKCDLLVTRDHAVELAEGEYFICDLIGADVFEYCEHEESKHRLGELKEVMQTGANDVYVVEMEDKKEVLFPVIPDCVKVIDVKNKRVELTIMNGLME